HTLYNFIIVIHQHLAVRRSTDRYSPGQEISMKKPRQRPAFSLLAIAMITALLLRAGPCLAAQTAAELPWDRTLFALQDMLTSYIAPAAIGLALSGAAILYALGGCDKQAGRLLRSGVCGCIALAVVHLMNYVLP
ncbi:MAG: TrbC/VirB2 family protein, partial [Candidatus Binataceae bacterium]